jgi:hypothetical protein
MTTSHATMPKLTGVIRPIIRVPVTYMRDRIVIDAAFEKEIRDELAFRRIAPGTKTGLETPLYVVARQIVHAPKYDLKLTGHPLVLVADHYDGNGGSIDTTDYASQAGTGEAGGVGGNGKPGASGKTAPGITLVAQRVTDARLVATGRPGGRGGAGGEGRKGANAIWDTGSGSKTGGPVVKPHCVSDGKDGGIGGNGGPGGKGAAGGAITVRYVSKEGEFTINGKGGAGGKGGAAGAAGKGGAAAGKCLAGKPGKPGKEGPDGAPGDQGKVVASALTERAWWTAAAEILGEGVSRSWINYRTRVGDYRFRTYNPGDSGSDHARRRVTGLTGLTVGRAVLTLAGNEFKAARLLAAGAGARDEAKRAATLLGYLDKGLTPVGIGYQQDLRPDFSFYEDFITDYQGRKDALFGETLQLLLDIKNTADKSKLAGALRSHAQGMSVAAEKDSLHASNEQNVSQNVLEQAKNRLLAIQAELQAIKDAKEREDAEISFGDVVIGVVEVVGAVVAIAGAAFTAAQSVTAYIALIGTVASTAAAAAEAANEIDALVDLKDPFDPQPTPKAKALTGDLTQAIEHTRKLVDKGKAVVQLFEGESDDEYYEKERELLIRAFDATVEVNLRTIDVEQAKLAAESAKQKWDVYRSDTESLQDLASGFEKDMAVLVRVAGTLIRQFQTYVDHFIAYGFRRALAFDRYTLAPASQSEARRFEFDYGYVHPDKEEHAYSALRRNDGSRVLQLLDDYVTSLSSFEPANLRKDYDDYWNTLSFGGHHTVSVTDPAVLKSLAGSGSATFQVTLAEFGEHTELKIGQVGVALIGARTSPNHTWVQVNLDHLGPEMNVRKNGTEVTIDAPRRYESVAAQIGEIDPQGLDDLEKQQFWGRSPAARWRIGITPEAAAQAGLDLSALTEIQLAVKYAYFNRTA